MDDYELTYWLGTNDNQGEFITRSVKINKRYISELFTNKAFKFLPFLDEDEHKPMIPTDNINQIKSIN